MKVVIHKISSITIDEFADSHNLIMEVRQTSKDRYVASFQNCEIMRTGVLVSEYGEGITPKDAIDNYKSKISTQQLAFNAYTKNRVNITVPILK